VYISRVGGEPLMCSRCGQVLIAAEAFSFDHQTWLATHDDRCPVACPYCDWRAGSVGYPQADIAYLDHASRVHPHSPIRPPIGRIGTDPIPLDFGLDPLIDQAKTTTRQGAAIGQAWARWCARAREIMR
jgi:hypothetical protein